MKRSHVPTIDTRYWVAITLASIFGTNLGDFYAHQSGLGLIGGLPILVALFGGVYWVERMDRRCHDMYYWLCIIIMRTSATNIADYLAGRRGLSIDRLSLSIGLGLALAVLAWWSARTEREVDGHRIPKSLPATDVPYWVAMLTAGVLGTVLGDFFEKLIGQGMAAVTLAICLTAALLIYKQAILKTAYAYWLVIGVARTTGTAIGDWLAENKMLQVGLPVSTVLTGLAFVGVIVLWRNRCRTPALVLTSVAV
jgi:uncharacterized membrane-anchored protein